jgi:hypothetical protein
MALLTALFLVITVRTYDGYGLPARDFGTAVRVASRTLAAAGVTTNWIDCSAAVAPDRCGAVAGRSELVVRIIRGPGGRDSGDALGTAAVETGVKEGSFASLYADRIVAQAVAAGSDPGTLLGRAAAHEIGHLLIGTTAHAPHGLMRARWSRSELQRRFERDWLFSPHEAAQLQSRVAARTAGAPLTPDVAIAITALQRHDGR